MKVVVGDALKYFMAFRFSLGVYLFSIVFPLKTSTIDLFAFLLNKKGFPVFFINDYSLVISVSLCSNDPVVMEFQDIWIAGML
jgi:hypothetical protein